MIYIFIFTLLLVGTLLHNKGKASNYLFIVLLTMIWLMIGLRDVSMVPDTQDYADDFRLYSHMEFSRMIDYAFSERTEPLYVIITWCASLFSDHYSASLLLWALFPVVGLYRLLRDEFKSCRDYSLAIMVAWMIGAVYFFMTAVRQAAVIGILMWSYHYFKSIEFNKSFFSNKNLYLFILGFVSSALIHNSTILFLPAFLVKYIRFRTIYVIIAVFIYLFSRTIQLETVVAAASFLFTERFEQYGVSYFSELSLSGFIIQLLLFLICFLKKKDLLKEESNHFLFSALLVGLLLESLSVVLGEFHRMSFYYSIFTIILVPKSLKEFRTGAVGYMINILFVIACLVYLFLLNSSYMPIYKTSISLFS